MAKSVKKRGLQYKPKSKKSILKDETRMQNNHSILKKLSEVEK